MQAVGITTWWPWFLGLSLVALAGLFLMWRGLRPRRTGTTPYCRKCGYNLTGTDRTADEARCPECGSNVSDDSAVVFGERIRRWRRVVIGLILLLLGAAPLCGLAIGIAHVVDWYRFKPTAWVLWDLRSNDTTRADKAFREITRRKVAQELSTRQIGALAEVCLTEQARTTLRPGVGSDLIRMLGDLHRGNDLSADQRKRFFDNAVRIVSVATGLRAGCGDKTPLTYICEPRLPPPLQATISAREVRRGPTVIVRDAVITTVSGCGGGTCSASGPLIPLKDAGQYELEIDLEILIGDDPREFHVTRNPLHRRTETFTVTADVLPPAP